jgi:cytoskeleton protein RodZ
LGKLRAREIEAGMNLQARPTTDTDIGPGAIGDLLRASRLRQGQELSDVARALRIRTVYLQAIEEARYEDLPGTVYAIGFIRSYADHLGLDGEHLIERFKADASGQKTTRKPLMSFPAMVPENGIPRGALITLGAVILIGAYGAWYFLSTKDMYVADLIPPVPEAITRALEASRSGITAVAERARNDSSVVALRQAEQKATDQQVSENPADSQAVAAPVAIAPPPVPALPSIAAPVATLAPPPAPPPSPSVAVTPPPIAASAPAPARSEPSPAPAPIAEPSGDEEDEVERTPPPSLATVPALPTRTESQAAPQSAAAVLAAKPEASAQGEPITSDSAPVALDDRGGVDAPAMGSQLASLPGASGDPAREIVLKANVDSWIQIRDTMENKLVLTRLLRKGEQYTVPAREGLTLVTGNAGGLDVTVGGDSTPSLGPIGVVRRNIMLDPERLRAGTAIVE